MLKMMRQAIVVLAALLAVPAAAQEVAKLLELSATEVAGLIDATSFRNSIGPRRQEGLRTFSDYGFTEVELVGQTAELYEADRSWMFGITVLDASDERVVVCVLDRALGGPTYHTQEVVAFERGEGGLLVANGESVEDPVCAHKGE